MIRLALPTDVEVLDQGFPFKPSWWRRYVEPPWWPTRLDALPHVADRPGYQRIARRDVFSLADDPSPEGRVRLLVGAFAWGTGDAAFLVGRRVRVFIRTPLDVVAERLAAAADLLRTEGPVAAYESLLARQRNHVKFLGPAFFTKYLHFAAGYPATVEPQPLILDKFVARGVNATFDGWALADNGWSGRTYGRYLRLAEEQAAQAAPATPAAVELALFKAAR